MFMFCVFAVTDLVIIGIFYAVYGTRRKYSEGMLLGVHLPQSAAESEEVTAFMARYCRNTKIFYSVNVVISTAICGFCFWYFSVFMIVWSVWLLEFCIGAMLLLYGTHRKLYDMKVEKGWIEAAAAGSWQWIRSGGAVWPNGLVCPLAPAFLRVDPDAVHRCGYQALSGDVR